jgi:hypothetical protein
MVRKKRPAVWEGNPAPAIFVAAMIAAVLWEFHPPLYQYDGYKYFQAGYDILNQLNPHHLLWLPLIGLINHAAASIHANPISAVQFFGVVCVALTCFLTFNLLQDLGLNIFQSCVLVLFIASSPYVWTFSTQDEPYNLLGVLSTLLLITLAPRGERDISFSRLSLGMLLLASCVGLQQATVLWVPAIAFYLWKSLAPEQKVKGVIFWCAGNSVLIAVLYAIALLVLKRFVKIPGAAYWMTKYAHTQHALQIHWPNIFPQSAVGIVRTFYQTNPIEDWLWQFYTETKIAWIYFLFFAAAIGAGMFCLRRDTPNESESRSDRIVLLSAVLVCSWAIFCVAWEPTNYYWYVVLVPFTCLLASRLRGGRNRRHTIFSFILILGVGWNAYANYQFDRYYEKGAPAKVIPQILSELSAKDRFIVISRGRPRNTDYDLIGGLLPGVGRSNEVCLMEDFILAQNGVSWEDRLSRWMEQTWREGGKIYFAAEMQDEDAYDIFGGMISSYEIEKYRNSGGPLLHQSVGAFLRGYKLEPSSLQLGDDRFFEVKPPRDSW